MPSTNNTLYCQYGAYALKANYQLNLFLGQIAVIVLLALGLTVSAILPKADTVVVPVIPPRDTTGITPVPPLIIIPTSQPGGPRPKLDHGVIPVPVADTTLDDVIPSQSDLGALINFDTIVGTGVGDAIPDSAPESFPPPDSFIAVEIPAELILESRPAYPELVRQAGLEGTVWIKALVNKEGDVDSAFVAKSSSLEALDQAAVRAARMCKYSPAKQNGRPTRVWVTYPVKFTLDGH